MTMMTIKLSFFLSFAISSSFGTRIRLCSFPIHDFLVAFSSLKIQNCVIHARLDARAWCTTSGCTRATRSQNGATRPDVGSMRTSSSRRRRRRRHRWTSGRGRGWIELCARQIMPFLRRDSSQTRPTTRTTRSRRIIVGENDESMTGERRREGRRRRWRNHSKFPNWKLKSNDSRRRYA